MDCTATKVTMHVLKTKCKFMYTNYWQIKKNSNYKNIFNSKFYSLEEVKILYEKFICIMTIQRPKQF
jgi:hypothetical protein